MKKLQNSADSTQQYSEQGSDVVTVPEIKLSPGFSLNDHTGSYTTVLAGGGGSVAMMMGGTEDRLNADTLAGRRDDTSLQGTATTTVAAREAGGDMTMKAVLLWLIDITIFNLAFLTAMEATATS
ncbi:hypothetical protein BDBG_00497 [Blastomyces gilchristii SLH14081]|uniref:Uncharacterized protein n=1 Tax=Blastomyces gilchristii (strain SLH14081) TaxID=559298 RepID=A0A179U948_BLAGS|nr:uncharacterized protein BDBG_00497 [Blastomyces gilchristii SLH14081]OAT03819.1 hypothetical protein BDBG_00497 [Blastomyces gilchristii SLH14081]